MTSLWRRLDLAFAAAFRGAMGYGGPYTSLTLADVQVNEVWNPDAGEFPRLILYSTTARISRSEHGGGGVQRLDVTYPYMAVAITAAGSYDAARADAQELFGRMLSVLASPGPILQAAVAADPTSTEQAVRVLYERGAGATGIEVRGRNGSNGGRWLGIAVLAWSVETRTGI